MTEKVEKLTVGYRATENIYVAADRVTVVPAGDKRSAFMVCGKGQVLSEKQFAKLKFPNAGTSEPLPDAEQRSAEALPDAEKRGGRKK